MKVIGLGFQADRRRSILLMVVTGIGSVLIPLSALLLKTLADDLGASRGTRALADAIALSAVVLVMRSLTIGAFSLRMSLRERVRVLVECRLIEHELATPSIEQCHNAERLDVLTRVRQNMVALTSGSASAIGLIGTAVQTVLSLGLLFEIQPALVGLSLAGLPCVWAARRAEQLRRTADNVLSEKRRLSLVLLRLASAPSSSAEIKVYALEDEVLRRYSELQDDIERLEDDARFAGARIRTLGWLGFGLVFLGAIALLVMLTVQGRSSAGDLVLLLTLASRLNGQIASVAAGSETLLSSVEVTESYLTLACAHRSSGAREVGANPTLTRGIELEHVSFRYPGSTSDTLHDVSVQFPAGTVVGLAGPNGAGKSTLVKLLCGFYRPLEGTVRVDGVELDQLDLRSWQASSSAVFQDAVRFEFVARETVGIGSLESGCHDSDVEAAVTRGGARVVIRSLPKGLDTELGGSFEGGVELSGGQWQRLALARAMMRPAPLVMYLDEPAANLDPQMESRMLRECCEIGNRSARLVVIVSHRLSALSRADVVVWLDKGRIVEVGSHDQLIALGGRYAQLFNAQALAYG